jgi:hypothetical protein
VSSKIANEKFKNQLRQEWKISDSGEMQHMVGITVEWDRSNHSVFLSQTALIDRIITQFGQFDANPLSIPMTPGLKLRRTPLSSLTEEARQEITKLPYRSLVGSITPPSCVNMSRHLICRSTTITVFPQLISEQLNYAYVPCNVSTLLNFNKHGLPVLCNLPCSVLVCCWTLLLHYYVIFRRRNLL